jgi:hypothetical protein
VINGVRRPGMIAIVSLRRLPLIFRQVLGVVLLIGRTYSCGYVLVAGLSRRQTPCRWAAGPSAVRSGVVSLGHAGVTGLYRLGRLLTLLPAVARLLSLLREAPGCWSGWFGCGQLRSRFGLTLRAC